MTFKKFLDLVCSCYEGSDYIDFPINVEKPSELNITDDKIKSVTARFGVDEKLFKEWLIDQLDDFHLDFNKHITNIKSLLERNQKGKDRDRMILTEFEYEKRMWQCFAYITD